MDEATVTVEREERPTTRRTWVARCACGWEYRTTDRWWARVGGEQHLTGHARMRGEVVR